MNDFYKWWSNGGSKEWSLALDAEGGTLQALQLVFAAGQASGLKAGAEVSQSSSETKRPQKTA